jgi:hypothetical protein
MKLISSEEVNNNLTKSKRICADCGVEIGLDKGPVDGWQLENKSVVCHACCIADTKRFIDLVISNF